jgi:SAM-dependent methyltransferase
VSYRLRRLVKRQVSRYQRFTTPQVRDFESRFDGTCPCCGGSAYKQLDILSDDLIDVWGLSKQEMDCINRQQGFRCAACGSRLRSMALAAWLLRHFHEARPLCKWAESQNSNVGRSILEINEAGELTPHLNKLSGHVLATYPDVDIQELPFADASFDIVIHSDTLEHVPDPVQALSECRRVLVAGGHCVFTVPMLVNRLTRSTTGSLPSYHGASDSTKEDFRVRTEYGADVWRTLIIAGFRDYQLFSFEYPSALVHVGMK